MYNIIMIRIIRNVVMVRVPPRVFYSQIIYNDLWEVEIRMYI